MAEAGDNPENVQDFKQKQAPQTATSSAASGFSFNKGFKSATFQIDGQYYTIGRCMK